jgi:hypothetical protein
MGPSEKLIGVNLSEARHTPMHTLHAPAEFP